MSIVWNSCHDLIQGMVHGDALRIFARSGGVHLKDPIPYSMPADLSRVRVEWCLRRSDAASEI